MLPLTIRVTHWEQQLPNSAMSQIVGVKLSRNQTKEPFSELNPNSEGSKQINAFSLLNDA